MMKTLFVLMLAAMMAGAQNVPPSAFAPLGRIGMGAWSPLRLGDKLAAWFDADDPATVLDATGNPAYTGAAVQTWLDKSGYGRHASAPFETQRPTRQAGVQNGRTVLRTDGDDLLIASNSGAILRNKTAAYIFVVAKDAVQTGGTATHPVFLLTFNTSFIRFGVYGRGAYGNEWAGRARRRDSDALANALVGAASGHNLVMGFADYAAGFIRSSINSGSVISTALAGGAGTSDDTDGTNATLFSDAAQSFFPTDSEIAEVIVVNASMTAAEIASVQKYLKNKWGTP